MSRRIKSSSFYRVFSIAFTFVFAYASAAAGFNIATTSMLDAIRNAVRSQRGDFTDTPRPVYRGPHPGRDPIYRGGKWNTRTLSDLHAATIQRRLRWGVTDGLWAGIGDFAFAQVGSGGGESGGGGSGSGEGGSGSGGSGGGGVGGGTGGSSNTNSGNQLHALPIVSWLSRGQTRVDLWLYHNSLGSYTGAWGAQWSSTYDVDISYTAGSSAIVRWADGTNDAYTVSGSTFTPPTGVHDSLIHNTDGSWTITSVHQAKYGFNSSGLLTSVKDRNGNTVTVNRNTAGLITSITDASARSLSFSYDTSNRVSSITDPLSRTWTFTYSTGNDLTTVHYPPRGGTNYTRSFGYDSAHDVTSETTPLGKVWSWTYDSSNRVTGFSDPLSHATTISYTSSSTTFTDPLSHSITYNYSSGQLASIVDQAGFSTAFTWDANLNLSQVVDKRGKLGQ